MPERSYLTNSAYQMIPPAMDRKTFMVYSKILTVYVPFPAPSAPFFS